MNKKKFWRKALKTLISVSIIAVILAIAYFALRKLVPNVIIMMENGSEEEIVEYIRGMGSVKGVITLALLQALQVFSIVLPGVAVWVAAGILFPIYIAYPVCHISFMLVNAAVFYVSRRYHGKLTKIMFDSEEDGTKMGLIKNSRNPAYMTLLACLIPLVPNGIIPYLSAGSDMSFKSFIKAVYFGSIPQFIVFTSIGGRIIRGDFVLAAALVVIMLAVVLVLYFKREKVLDAIEKLDTKRKEFRDKKGTGSYDGEL